MAAQCLYSLLCQLVVSPPALLECFPSVKSQLCEITLPHYNHLHYLYEKGAEHPGPHALIHTVEAPPLCISTAGSL